jgi:hypothetical protein
VQSFGDLHGDQALANVATASNEPTMSRTNSSARNFELNPALGGGPNVRAGSKGEVVSLPAHVCYWGSARPVVASRESTRFTWDADHSPPRGAVIPLWFNPDAKAQSDWAPMAL